MAAAHRHRRDPPAKTNVRYHLAYVRLGWRSGGTFSPATT